MSITSAPYGKLPDGRAVTEYTLSNASGMTARVITLGGIITALEVPDRDGKRADIVLGKADLEAYAAGHPCFGTITGRVVGRITEGKFSLDGVDYALEQNDGGSPNHLHGGSDGFDKQLWEGSTFTDGDVE
ncbi:MAG: galactose-1-epimerase, partial [Verrucomicrobiota bacterium]